MLTTRLAVLGTVAAAVLLVPASALAGFCTDKQNGYWCDGDSLVLCKGGSQASSSSCECGCQSMPPGVDDQCKACSGFCSDKQNGYWCDGDNLVLCKNGGKASSSSCECGCQSMPPGVDDECKSCGGFCSGKQSGYWCDGDNLVLCQGGNVASSNPCECGCLSMPEGVDDQCQSCGGGFCSGKQSGYWCDGSNLVLCQGGDVASSSPCECGCQSMPEGVDDQCQSCGGGFCTGKRSGYWCDGSNLVICQGGNVASSSPCECGCQSMPDGVDDQCQSCGGGFCSGKTSGYWCDGNNLVLCQGGNVASSNPCECGCQPMSDGVDDQCQSCGGNYCTDKGDGWYCAGATRVQCSGGQQKTVENCQYGCSGGNGGATCNPPPDTGFCAGKADSDWCDGIDLVTCGGGKVVADKPCPNGCQPMPDGQPDVCKEAQPWSFCQDKADGGWCDGDLLVQCESGGQVSAVVCPNGCLPMPEGTDDLCEPSPQEPGDSLLSVTKQGECGIFSGSVNLWAGTKLPVFNQKSWPDDKLGTCSGLTIKSSGCLISTLSMLYAYIGVTRTVDDQTGNSPPLEDAWRSVLVEGHPKGYAAAYTDDGKYLGECNVIWGKNPPGVTLQQHYNPSTSCIRYQEAVAIAQSLNSGMPVVGGVHWIAGLENQHWVLITGADSGGIRFNDPWGGGSNLYLGQGALGAYTLDSFYTPSYSGGQGSGEEEGALIDENGEPIDDERSVGTLPSVLDDDGNPQSPLVIEEDDAPDSGGCTTALAGRPSDERTALLLLALLVPLALSALALRSGRSLPASCTSGVHGESRGGIAGRP